MFLTKFQGSEMFGNDCEGCGRQEYLLNLSDKDNGSSQSFHGMPVDAALLIDSPRGGW